ncbi:GIN domain-containing protein [Mangrovimonas sp. DI 80]|uniref:GIN domain-containing protein n=1 Tax=Mangrovimonas sp. DI 80 TaxID=1779330 RepID=UPI000976B233|nr:DUF2807 domain-containing protein [Mangrovimonas sp. DI 80]OMP32800.1 DUF2807 domain-containing protein [Mangrovimonas sp. DI 80]
MSKILLTLCIGIGFILTASGQSDDKIKGDRNVTIKQTYIDAFNKIIVAEDFSVEIIYNSKPSVEIETDDNLHEIILFEVKDSTLVFSSSKKITSSKKMHITVNYSHDLKYIEVKDDGEVRSLTSLELKNTSLKTSGSARAYLNINATNFEFSSHDKSKVKLNVSADSSKIILNDNSKTEALINSKYVKLDMYQRADANIEGASKSCLIRTDNSSSFEGKEFTVKTCNLVSDLSSYVAIGVEENVTIDAAGNSEIYLYHEPQITINKFTGTAKLQKKETN